MSTQSYRFKRVLDHVIKDIQNAGYHPEDITIAQFVGDYKSVCITTRRKRKTAWVLTGEWHHNEWRWSIRNLEPVSIQQVEADIILIKSIARKFGNCEPSAFYRANGQPLV